MSINWDKEVDVLVVGSGAGGLFSALVAAKNHADVLIVEKDRLWGGTSATSGGGIWIPGSDQAKAAGFEDNLDDAFKYVRALSADNVPDENIRAFVDNAAPMLRWLTENTPVRYAAMPYPDYHAENPGGSAIGFRTHLPDTFDGKLLGDTLRTQRLPSPAASLFGFLQWTFAETYELLYRTKGWFTHLCINMARYAFDWPFRFTSKKDRRLTLGNALTGGLRHALTKRTCRCGCRPRSRNWCAKAMRSSVSSWKRRASLTAFAPARAWCWPPAGSTRIRRCATAIPRSIPRPRFRAA